MKELTLEMNEVIRESFKGLSLDETDGYITQYNLDDLEDGDLVFFPFNIRAGIYKVSVDRKAPPIIEMFGVDPNNKSVMLGRNSSGNYIVEGYSPRVWLMKADKELVEWKQWEDIESVLKGLVIGSLEGKPTEEHGFSEWYLWDWDTYFPRELLPKEVQHDLKLYEESLIK